MLLTGQNAADRPVMPLSLQGDKDLQDSWSFLSIQCSSLSHAHFQNLPKGPLWYVIKVVKMLLIC